MREMKDSGIEWIGEIPVDWELSKIGAVYEERNEKVSDVDFPPLSVTKQGVVPQLETAAKTNDGENRKLIRKNDFVINSRSDRRGSCGISEYDGSCSLINTVLKPRRNMCNAYYSFVFRSERFADEFYRWGNGIVDDLWSTKWSNMKRIYIPAPSLQEQYRIADYLDRKCSQIDAIIARQQEVIEKLKAYKLSVITEAVTKGLNPDTPMKDSGVEWIGEIPEHWTVSALRYGLENIQTGPFGSQLHAEDYIEDGIFVINPANIVEGCIVPDNRCSVTELKAQELSRHILNKGDIIFARRGEMGRCAYFGGSFQRYLCGTGCIKIHCNANLMPEFISWFLQTSCVKQYLTLNSVGTTMANLNTTIISSIPVVFPPISEQEKVVEFIKNKISEIDCVLKNKLSIVEKLTEYKKSLIYEVVTGKKEV
ncbi:restriction endonuclease subunit S [uncultured Flavonifractor sp.]|uniref:restriction endonuclease subunit S n=1 Tax=uncultured Flavonifractor sp. TaxID=1193534 RepID=UPI002620922F|nr:restriction endonuclease subunit S [uncultured Flavonifractor sp.]